MEMVCHLLKKKLEFEKCFNVLHIYKNKNYDSNVGNVFSLTTNIVLQ